MVLPPVQGDSEAASPLPARAELVEVGASLWAECCGPPACIVHELAKSHRLPMDGDCCVPTPRSAAGVWAVHPRPPAPVRACFPTAARVAACPRRAAARRPARPGGPAVPSRRCRRPGDADRGRQARPPRSDCRASPTTPSRSPTNLPRCWPTLGRVRVRRTDRRPTGRLGEVRSRCPGIGVRSGSGGARLGGRRARARSRWARWTWRPAIEERAVRCRGWARRTARRADRRALADVRVRSWATAARSGRARRRCSLAAPRVVLSPGASIQG